MLEHSLTIVVSTFLFTVTMLPSVYLRYLPFRPVLSDETRSSLLHGYAIIFFCENSLILLLIFSDLLPYTMDTYKRIYFFAGYAPYFALNLALIRPYWAQHAFILGIQQILATTTGTCAAIITLFLVGIAHFFDYVYLFFLLYLTLYLLTFPLVLPFFRQIFLRFSSVSTERFWLYIAPLPFLVFYRETFHSVGDKVVALDFFISRLLFAAAGIVIGLVAWRGLEHILQQAAMTERSLALLRRMNSFRAYTRSLQEKQARLAIVRHDLRHNAKMLADLIARGEDETAIQLVRSLNHQIDATSVEHFAENPMVDSALAVYVRQARAKKIPIDVKIDTPLHSQEISTSPSCSATSSKTPYTQRNARQKMHAASASVHARREAASSSPSRTAAPSPSDCPQTVCPAAKAMPPNTATEHAPSKSSQRNTMPNFSPSKRTDTSAFSYRSHSIKVLRITPKTHHFHV